ncbi:efflux RND transporter periplasmic adaptor subunit [Thalassotalea sp. 1_MG-2023]|uniref:efflux RND transporter periplasmic adaptor subunit n=1 Tax=Thalassotalea sp. 1_MG-2023 TaxID=3062680 RepID=UPI0026E2CADD|nr:efflux RND transporter periplasmic adaptor subunit [Thalassotalea sp. 1_MG-2023]MDO6425461.1 efflux RND transporter periplasmic adaptor subunit [Thalassotalea sp. 1_MG-2023]
MKLLFLFFISFLLLGAINTNAQQYATQEIDAATFEKNIVRVGKTRFKKTHVLSFKSQGYLTTLAVDEGDSFSAKSVLASLETTELKALKNANYTELLQAKRDVKRVNALIKNGLSSQQALEMAKFAEDSARERYRISYYNLEKSEIVAPFNGVVLSRYTRVNELQSPGTPVLEVASTENNFIVEVAVTTDEIRFISRGQQVEVEVMGVQGIAGMVSKVPVKANSAANMYLVEVALTNFPSTLKPIADQLATVRIPLSTQQAVFAVPNSALIEMNNNGHAVVLVKHLDTLKRQAFVVVGLDKNFIYLQADDLSSNLSVITQGWQQFELSEL